MQTNGILNTVSLSQLTDLIRREFTMQQEFVPVGVAQSLFIFDDISMNSGDSRRYDEIDTDTYARIKPQGQDSAKGNVGVGYFKTLYVQRFSMEIEVTFEERRYNRYPEIQGKIISLAQFCPQRMELDLTHRFTFSGSTSYVNMDGDTVDTTTGDGFALCYSAHTLKFSSLTYRNRISGDPVFSQGGLEAAEQLTVSQIYNNFGQRRIKNFNTIITGDDPNTVNTVKQVLQSTADISAPNAGVVNVYRAKYNHVMLRYMATTATGVYDSTKSKYWFLAAVGQSVLGWQAFLGMSEMPHLLVPAPGNNGEDIHNDNWTYGTRTGYGIVTLNGIGLIGSLPTTS